MSERDNAPEEVVEWVRADAAVRDGIGEDDNEIPLWFNLGFYGGIVFGILYILFYQGTGWTQQARYEAELEVAEAKYAAVRAALPTTNPYRGDEAAIAEGEETFRAICSACHLPDGRGLVGPSLIDPYWKYGDGDEALYVSVNDGRPLGMPPWGAQLGSEKIWKVLAYMETLPKVGEPGVGSPDYVAPAPAGSR